ncbi:uracil-DNA glycosylase [Sphingomonas sp. LR59]|uniref:uracil-DNA glycosylase n=1 Tax=Sphingomonas sp. LR59 TaxID=3050232 RepID=UPI002FE047C4
MKTCSMSSLMAYRSMFGPPWNGGLDRTPASAHLGAVTTPSSTDQLFSLLVEPSWRDALRAEFDQPYMAEIANALEAAELSAESGDARVAPCRSDIFRALNLVSVDKVSAVIVGQDPYPNPGDADGLAFSVRRDAKLPSALSKILAEARRDLGWNGRKSGNLKPWAKSGVLLLNAALTNLVGYTWAHGDLDWPRFTRAVLGVMARRERKTVILLWGGKAGEFKSVFDGTDHKVLLSDHPCASRKLVEGSTDVPFNGSKPFSAANAFLRDERLPEIDWSLPPAGPRPARGRRDASSGQRASTRRRRSS